MTKPSHVPVTHCAQCKAMSSPLIRHTNGSYVCTGCALAASADGEADPVAWVQPGYREMLQKYGSCSMRAEPVEPLDYIMPLYASPPAGVKDDAREFVAKVVYSAMKWAAERAEKGTPPEWVERGNSLAQSEARRVARNITDYVTASLQPDTQAPAASAPAQAEALPAGVDGEAIARAICKGKGLNPDCQKQGAARDGTVDGHWDINSPFGRPYDNRWHYGWRDQVAAAEAVLALLSFAPAQEGR